MKLKKIISILLCVSIVIGILSIGATQVFATEIEHDYSTCPYNTGYRWDFSTGSANSVQGDPVSTLSFVRTHSSTSGDTGLDISNGVLYARQSIYKYSKPVTLNSKTNDWTFEIVVKANSNTSIGAVASTSSALLGSTFIYINANGDMSIGTSGGLTANDGTVINRSSSNYTYYKVSQEAYDNSILNSGNFAITDYHTYQLKSIGGVFSTWVDGEKIGDLAMSENYSTSSTRKTSDSEIFTGKSIYGTGTQYDFSNLKLQYIGVGGGSTAIYGLKGSVKSYALFTGHSFTNADDTDCNNCDYVREAPHNFVQTSTTAATCASHGVINGQCSLCGQETTINTFARTGYTWDFSSGSAQSLNGNPHITLTFNRTNSGSTDTSVEITDGEFCAHRSIYEMSQSVTLDSKKHDWTIDIVAKGDGANDIRTVFSTDDEYVNSKFIYINKFGEMWLAKKGGYTADDGTAVSSDYTFYKVSQEAYDNSILGRGGFDVTQYHTYQMKSIGGVFSTWVDGEKIGDLCFTEQQQYGETRKTDKSKIFTGKSQYGIGTQFDFSTMAMKWIGNGTKKASTLANWGLDAEVKYLGIYPGHSFDSVCDADCNNTGCDYVRVAPHSWDDGVVTAYPTDTEEGVKTYTCTLCGETYEESIPCISNSENYVWDFAEVTDVSNPTIMNTSGSDYDNSLSLFATKISGVTDAIDLVSNGTLNLTKQTTLELEKPVTLNTANDWMVEIEAKNPYRAFFSTDKGLGVGKYYFYINTSGNLQLVTKASYTDDNGTEWKSGKSDPQYIYYSVADFANKKPAGFKISDYHTYQMRCTNGTLSYWLDGEKIGDLVQSAQSDGTGLYTQGNGAPFNFSNLVVKYTGCGNTGSPAYTSQALTGTVKRLAIYTDTCKLNYSVGLAGVDAIDPAIGYPGKSITLPVPDAGETGAEFLGWNEKIDGTGQMYYPGDNYEFSSLESQGLFGIWGNSITVETSGQGFGTVTPDVDAARTGDTVTLTVAPNDDSVLTSISSDDVELTQVDDTTYTFTMPDHAVTINAEFGFADGMGAHLVGHSISLDGDIAVNFYMQLSDDIASSETAEMQFSVPETSAEYQSQTVKVSDVEPKDGYYKFNCRVAAKDINSEITAKIVDGDQEGTVYTYSVKRYADYLIDHQNDSQTFADAVPLVQAMLVYGENAEYFFNKSTTQPADVEADVPEKDSVINSLPDGVYFDGATLSLKSMTTLSLYFYSTDDITLTATDKDGNPVEFECVHNVNDYVIRIRNIAAYELNDNFTVTVTANGQSGTVTYSPTTYCYKVLASDSTADSLKNTVKALYLYWEEADKYFD